MKEVIARVHVVRIKGSIGAWLLFVSVPQCELTVHGRGGGEGSGEDNDIWFLAVCVLYPLRMNKVYDIKKYFFIWRPYCHVVLLFILV